MIMVLTIMRIQAGFSHFFLYVILKLCTEFQYPNIPAAGQKVCGGVVWCGGGVVVVVLVVVWWVGGLSLL